MGQSGGIVELHPQLLPRAFGIEDVGECSNFHFVRVTAITMARFLPNHFQFWTV